MIETEGVKWLDTWRQTKIYDIYNKYFSLDITMSTLRQVAKGREVVLVGHAQAAVAPGNGKNNGSRSRAGSDDPEALCRRCRNKHRNKQCFRQHPELRRFAKKSKGKSKATFGNIDDNSSIEDSDSDCFALSAVARASSIKLKNCLLYDTGASHHFMRNKSDFFSMKKLSKLFEFDQAVGNSKLSYQGSCRVKIGSLTLKLSNVLYSPNSSCDIISAVRLKEDHGIVPANRNENLIYTNTSGPDTPIARLRNLDGVLFIQELSKNEPQSLPLAAPGVARIPNTSSAQKWHERLGHTGQKILKQTIQSSIGLENIDFPELGT